MTKENKERIKAAKKRYDEIEHPDFPYPVPAKTNDNSTNAITKIVLNFLKWEGHQAERINTMGRLVTETKIKRSLAFTTINSGKKWIPTTGTKGSADISSTIKVRIGGREVGLSVKWEVKFRKDRQSDDQKNYERSVNSAGGHYFIVRDVDDFLEKYDELMGMYQ